MPAPTFSLPTTGTDPKSTTQEALEGAVQTVVDALWAETQVAVATADLEDDAVTLPKIADGSVNNAKLADMPSGTIKGRILAGTGAASDLTADDVATLIELPTEIASSTAAASEFAYRASLGLFLGVVAGTTSIPSIVSTDLRALQYDGDAAALARYRENLGVYLGDIAADGAIPVAISTDGRNLIAATPSAYVGLPYVDAGDLRVAGGASADRLLNDDTGITWRGADAFDGRIRALRDDGTNRALVTVSDPLGNVFSDGVWEMRVDVGQSNGRGSQSGGAGVVLERTDYPYPLNLVMYGDNVWGGFGANSTDEFVPSSITERKPLKGAVFGNNGTTSAESAALRYANASADQNNGWVPKLITANFAVGGQSIAQLGPTPPSDETAWENAIAYLERIAVLHDDPERIALTWAFMVQGESNTGTSDLGAQHDAYRASLETELVRIFDQDEPLRMISWQPASYQTNTGPRSILTHYLSVRAERGTFWCGGPSYAFPFVDGFLHHSSLGHDMRGEMNAEIIRRIERIGYYDPLHMTAATVTGANEITVTLSQAAQIDTSNTYIAAIANAGIDLEGATVSGVSVSGTDLIITTSDAASGATEVKAASSGQTDPRTEAAIPRTNIRATVSLGSYRSDLAMHQWLCAQNITIT